VPQHIPTPQALIDRLLRLLPHPTPARPAATSGTATEDRILDAALAMFTERGIRNVSMSQIALGAGISREWLYKHFRNRDAIVLAVGRREVVHFIDGLAKRVFELGLDDPPAAVTESFVYSVEYARDHALLQRILRDEPDTLNPQLLRRSGSIVDVAIQAAATYLTSLGDLKPDASTAVAETLVRLVASITLVPYGEIDLHDPEELRRYASMVVPAVMAMTGPKATRRAKR
jgi:AcrR family transcriptional regulator